MRSGFRSYRSDIDSRSDNSSSSKSFDIAHGRLAKEAAVFSVELADALVADFVSCARCVHAIHKYPLPCPLQPQLLLLLKADSQQSMGGTDIEVLKLPSVRSLQVSSMYKRFI